MSKSAACETQAKRRAYIRWEKEEQKKRDISLIQPVPPVHQAVSTLPQPPEPELSTKEYCEKIQKQVLQGISLALKIGEPWAYKEAVNILSKLLPEWKEKSTKKQIPLDAYQKLLEKALKK